ncbi:DM13 domain-containing protein [Colwellia sp. E2M01]|nr:DM13 domain-containing protein [Colwellia sp. E2M01]
MQYKVKTSRLLFSNLLIFALVGCGSDDDHTAAVEQKSFTGVFLDSAVQGLNYKTVTQSGKTNAQGEFTFLADEFITFTIGGIELPSTAAKLYLTPLSLYQTDDINHKSVVNLLRLLQSLDTDGDASNGIEISDSVHQLATELTLDFSATDFDQQVAPLIASNGAALQTLITADDAITHFQTTLAKINNSEMTSCTTSHSKVGYSGFFNTLAHNVSGKATIIDDCTIEISQFSYDGGGPEVFFYGAIDHAYASADAFSLGEKLTGTEYNNGTITITLPQNKSLDDLTGLSVWCVDFNANFGQMTFTP